MSSVPVLFESYKDFPAYVISMENSHERYLNTYKELGSLGFSKILKYPAVEAKNVDTTTMLASFGIEDLSKFGNCTNIGAHCCALSHLRLLEDFVCRDERYCLVFEDDVLASATFSKYKDLNDISYGDFDIIFFGGIFYSYKKDGMTYTDLNQVKELQGNKSYVSGSTSWQAHAYLCTRNFAIDALNKYKTWVNSSSMENPHCPYIDYYFTDSKYFNTKLLVTQDIPNLHEMRLHKEYSHNICGILHQDNKYTSTIQNY